MGCVYYRRLKTQEATFIELRNNNVAIGNLEKSVLEFDQISETTTHTPPRSQNTRFTTITFSDDNETALDTHYLQAFAQELGKFASLRAVPHMPLRFGQDVAMRALERLRFPMDAFEGVTSPSCAGTQARGTPCTRRFLARIHGSGNKPIQGNSSARAPQDHLGTVAARSSSIFRVPLPADAPERQML